MNAVITAHRSKHRENRTTTRDLWKVRHRAFMGPVLLLASLCLGACSAPGSSRISLPAADAQAAVVETPTPEGIISLQLTSGHSSRVNSIEISRDFRYALTASDDWLVLQWDIASGKVITRFVGHSGPVKSAVYSLDQRYVATAGHDGTMRLWDARSGAELRAFSIEPSALARLDPAFRNGIDFHQLAFMPGGRSIVAGTSAGAWVIDIENGAQTELIPEIGRMWTDITSIAVSEDGRWILAGLWSGARVWSGNNYAFHRVYQTGSGFSRFFNTASDDISAAALNADGSLIATGSDKGDIRLWDRGTSEIVWESDGHEQAITDIRFIADDELLLTTSEDGTLRTWNSADGRNLRVIEPRLGAIYSSSYDPATKTVGLAQNKFAQILRLSDFKAVAYLMPLSPTAIGSTLAVSPDRRFLAFGDYSGNISMLDLKRGFVVDRLTGLAKGYVTSLAFSLNSERLMAGFSEGELAYLEVDTGKGALRNTTSGEMTRTTRIGTEPIRSIDFSPPDGRYVAVTSDTSITVWDTHSDNPPASMSPRGISFRDSVYGAQFSEDGQYIIGHFLDESGILLWESGSWEPYTRVNGGIAPYHSGWITSVDYRAQGQRVLSGDSSGNVALWSMRPSTLLQELHVGRVRLVAFVQEGRTGLVVTAQGIHLWDLQGGQSEAFASGHEGAILSATLLPGERHLVTSGDDGTLRFWDIESRAQLLTHAPTFGNEWMSFAPNGLFDVPFGGLDVFRWRLRAPDGSVSTLPVESFQNEFFHDGLMPDLLAGERPTPPRNIGRIDRRLPSVRLLAPGVADTTDLRQRRVSVTLQIEAMPADARWQVSGGARDVKLFRNGRLVKTWPGDVLHGKMATTLQTEIALADGNNVLSAYAFNRHNVKSLDTDLALTLNPVASLTRRLHLLAVGVDDYLSLDDDLTMSVADARGIAASLPGSVTAGTAITAGNISLLEDSTATRTRILETLRSWSNGQSVVGNSESGLSTYSVQPEDILVLFFSGHGVATSSDFYFLAAGLEVPPSALQNAEDDDPRLAAAVSTRDLEGALRGIDAGQIVLILDTCYSGQVLHSDELRRGQLNTRGLAQLAFEKGVSVLTASQSNQTARASSSLGHGYLTHALLTEGLISRRADREPRDARITLVEWFEYAVERVPVLITEMNQQRQQLGMQRSALLAGDSTDSAGKPPAAPKTADFQQPRAYIPRYFYRSPEALFNPDS